MPRCRSPVIPPRFRSRLETTRLDTLAFLRAIDQALVVPDRQLQPYLHQLAELDADCAEALWAPDQPPGSLDLSAMVRDTLTALDRLPTARENVRRHLPQAAHATLQKLEQSVQETLVPRGAYNQIPGRDPENR